MRTDPTSIIPQLEEMVTRFDGNILRTPGETNIMTSEGADAVKELIQFLENVEPVPEMEW